MVNSHEIVFGIMCMPDDSGDSGDSDGGDKSDDAVCVFVISLS